MIPFPWDAAMQFGFGVLHLSSEAFWRMTPRELAHAVIAVRGRAPAPIARGDFDALMQMFPDGAAVIASEAKQSRAPGSDWIASSQELLAMTWIERGHHD